MEVLINYIPDIIFYLMTGYLFVTTYHFVALKQNSENVEHILMSSFITGYVICNVAYVIPFTISYYVDAVGILLSSVVVGYAAGKIMTSSFMEEVCNFLKIRDTVNKYMWDDLMDNAYPFRVIINYGDVEYEGWAHNIESYSNAPHISLASYTAKKDGQIVEDNRGNTTDVVVLDTGKANFVKVMYDKDSYKSKDIGYLCDMEKKYNSPNI